MISVRALYEAAVAGADAGAATRRALEREPPPARRTWLLGVGKAAVPMARAAAVQLRADGRAVAGGLVVAPAVEHLDDAIAVVPGDHPVPGALSAAAARAIGAFLGRPGPDDQLLVLLSGGATALVGAPVAGVTDDDYATLVRGLLRSGADITVMNALRKRVSRWGAGRLAAAVPCPVRCLAVSDVAGDDLATIGSGPCVPDATTATALRALIERERLHDAVPAGVARYLGEVARGERAETPKPGDPRLAHADARVILANRDALDAAA
ncbi:MAG TPA: DUF4147 domain-containing protein, partial [Gemmatimonadaceae bacterium]